MSTSHGADPVDPELLAILVCPACHGELSPQTSQHGQELVCGGCSRAYPVTDGIPVLLVDEARRTQQD